MTFCIFTIFKYHTTWASKFFHKYHTNWAECSNFFQYYKKQNMKFRIHYSIDDIKQKVDKEGAVLLRDTHIDNIEKLSEFGKIFGNTNVDMSCSAGPRKNLGRNIFTSNEAPSDKSIPPHQDGTMRESTFLGSVSKLFLYQNY